MREKCDASNFVLNITKMNAAKEIAKLASEKELFQGLVNDFSESVNKNQKLEWLANSPEDDIQEDLIGLIRLELDLVNILRKVGIEKR